MKKSFLIAGLAVIVMTGVVLWNRGASSQKNEEKLLQLTSDTRATVVSSSTCGCCKLYAAYLRRQGFQVQVSEKTDRELAAYKDEVGIPEPSRSCHTTQIGNYIVEGHVPMEAIEKLLKEKPDIKGIALPGMPSASPGMPGPKLEPFVIDVITNDGQNGGLFTQI